LGFEYCLEGITEEIVREGSHTGKKYRLLTRSFVFFRKSYIAYQKNHVKPTLSPPQKQKAVKARAMLDRNNVK